MFEEIKKFLNFPFELNIPEVKFDCIWSEIRKLPRVLTKKVILINNIWPGKQKRLRRFPDGRRNRNHYGNPRPCDFLLFSDAGYTENQVIFAEYVKQFIDSHQKDNRN